MEDPPSKEKSTYNLGFFLGPGFPLGLGSPSGPNAGPALLLTPFFLTSSVGGGIDTGTGVPTAAGVLALDSTGISPFELDAAGGGLEMVEEESFDGDSSLTGGAGSNDCRTLGGRGNLTIKLPFETDADFRRATGAAAGLVDGAMVRVERCVALSMGKGRSQMVCGPRVKEMPDNT